ALVVTSPLERCRETAQAVLDRQAGSPPTRVEDALTECDYGRWQGRALADLAREDLWQVVQRQPSAAVFPGGESLVEMHARAVGAVRRIDAEVEAEHGPGAVWAAVSHGDLLKAVLADALGLHLDLFQRLHVHPASLSVVRYAPAAPQVLTVNTDDGDLTWLAARHEEAQVGGGAGPAGSPPAS
ncbi:MSMEG_4193 family putative phosphomutase, partial [Georgenia sp. 311]|uniref:MSMEG_4193 family putative phosphomutase n=1 Tax=Georgenia sp. 311 TaxID=2585134 RepID=UPI0011129292